MDSDQSSGKSGLVNRTIGAIKWGYLGISLRIVLQLVAQIALTRLLGPEAFGVVAAAVLVILIAGIFAEMGLSVAIVQADRFESQDIRCAYSRAILSTLVVSAIILASADLIAILFENPRVAPVLRWMTLALVFQVLGTVSLGLLKRRFDIKSVQIAHLTSYLIGYFLVGITCAWMGAGEWSLVAAWISQTFVASVIQFARAPHDLRPTLRSGNAPLTAFGLRATVANLANWSIENIDSAMVGRSFGTTTLGAYSIAYNLVRTPVNHIVFSLQQVLQPFIARSRDDPKIMRKAYLALVWMVALVTMPMFIGLGVLAPTVIEALYGSAWLAAAPILVPLALAMPLQALQAVGGPVLWGSGNIAREIRVSFSMVAIMVVILGFASGFTAVAMAWGVFAAYLIRAVWVTACAAQIVGSSVRESLSMLLGGLLVGILVAAVLYVTNVWLLRIGVPPIARLATAIIVGALLCPAVIVVLARAVIPSELSDILLNLVRRLPTRFQPWCESRILKVAPTRP
ncbi:MAG: lipopolysaccharide biosynthesis protein [Burkholderiales bacterium]